VAAIGLFPTVFRIDWTTGVVESTGGLAGVTGYSGGFSLGNFNFLTPGLPGGSFASPSTSSHETGHSLNTALMGGVVLWINAVDQNIWPVRAAIAYGELLAEGHSVAMPPPPIPATLTPGYSLRLWY
jgi:hypothetical protein